MPADDAAMPNTSQTAPQALLLLGPTASGKSALSLMIAQRFDVEIVSIDSALVYRGMDIGSAKPTAEELSAVPHHLIDIREIDEPYSAADFAEDAERLVAQIRSRGRFPLIVGGTMLYAKAIREGMDELPSASPDVRARIAREGEALGWPVMHEKLRAVDPAAAERLSPNDKQRIGRALEVYEASGRPWSSFLGERQAGPLFPMITVGLIPEDRPLLHARIAERFDQMLQAGFLDEVRCLMTHPGFDPESPAMRAVGYRQAIEHLQGKMDFAAFRLAGIAATRQLAKRQLTWLRGMADVVRLDPFAIGAEGAYQAIASLLEPWAPKRSADLSR